MDNRNGKVKMEKKCLVLICGLILFAAFADIPENTMLLEAENFKFSGKNWSVNEKFSIYNMPSAGKALDGHNAGTDTASGTITVKLPGKYRLWVRYLDSIKKRNNSGFKVSLFSNGNDIADKEFDTGASKHADAVGEKKWGKGTIRFVWDYMDVELPFGDAEIKIFKCDSADKAKNVSIVDCFVLTSDMNYEPDISDFLLPLYVKVKMSPEQKTPVSVCLFGRRPAQPWFTKRHNINKRGLFYESDTASLNPGGLEKKDYIEEGKQNTADLLNAGDESPWVNIAPLFASKGLNRVSFYAVKGASKALSAEVAFSLCFSRDPKQGVLKTFSRQGSGAGMVCAIDLEKNDIQEEKALSSENLRRAEAVPPVRGQKPEKFIFATAMRLDPMISQKSSIDNELKALSLLGINTLRCDPALGSLQEFNKYGFKKLITANNILALTEKPDCLNASANEKIRQTLQQHCGEIKNNGLAQKTLYVNLRDEPDFKFQHLSQCDNCQKGFVEYLKKLRLKPEGLGIKDWNEASLQKDGNTNPALYYYSMMFRNHTMAELFRLGTYIICKELPESRSTSNFAQEMVYNMISRGADWFEILGTGALTFGWTEDWLNITGTYQLASYQMDVMRAACKKQNCPYGIYNILVNRGPWEIMSKGFTEIGHGASAMYFFNYGPNYAISSDQNSQRPEIYAPIKEICYATGAVEKHLINGKVRRGDAAMLLSITSDIWNYSSEDTQRNLFGHERTYLYLLLRHCNIRLDILNEDSLQDDLSKYKMLFIADSHLKTGAADSLVKWVDNGGTLYLGAGAAMFDEFNRPLKLNEAFGLKREKLSLRQYSGMPFQGLPGTSVLDTVTYNGNAIPVVCAAEKMAITGPEVLASFAEGKAAVYVTKYGKGQVIVCGFFPALSYLKEAIANSKKKPEKDSEKIYSCTNFPGGQRALMNQILKVAGCNPAINSSHYLVEANIIESDQAIILVLANWSGRKQEVSITIDDYQKFKKIYSVINESTTVTNQSGKTTVKLSIGPGDYIVCEK